MPNRPVRVHLLTVLDATPKGQDARVVVVFRESKGPRSDAELDQLLRELAHEIRAPEPVRISSTLFPNLMSASVAGDAGVLRALVQHQSVEAASLDEE